MEAFNQEYLKYSAEVAETCADRDHSEDCMVIGTSAIIDTEIDGAVGMNSGIFNNPFIIWGRYRKKCFRVTPTASHLANDFIRSIEHIAFGCIIMEKYRKYTGQNATKVPIDMKSQGFGS